MQRSTVAERSPPERRLAQRGNRAECSVSVASEDRRSRRRPTICVRREVRGPVSLNSASCSTVPGSNIGACTCAGVNGGIQ